MRANELKVDELSLKILAVLQKNSRLSYSLIGKEVGLSAPAVAERVKKMESMGIISCYTIELAKENLGLDFVAFIKISIPGIHAHQMAKAIEIAMKTPEVIECHRITGSDDMIIKTLLTSREHLKRIIDTFAPYGQLTTAIVIASFIDKHFMDLDLVPEILKRDLI